MPTTQLRFKIDDLESMVKFSDLSNLTSNDIINQSMPSDGDMQTSLSEMLDASNIAEIPSAVMDAAGDMFNEAGSALESFVGVNPTKLASGFFSDAFNSDTYDSVINTISNTLSNGLSLFVKCILHGLMNGYGSNYGGPGYGSMNQALNRLAKNCLGAAALGAISRDLGILVDSGYNTGNYGLVNHMSNNIDDTSLMTRVAGGVMMNSIARQDHAGMFDVMSSSVAGRIPTMYPNVMDTYRSNFTMPPQIRPNQYPQYGNMVFTGMNRVDPTWSNRPMVPQSDDFTMLLSAGGRVLGRNNPIAEVGLAYLAQNQTIKSSITSVLGMSNSKPNVPVQTPMCRPDNQPALLYA